MSINKIPIKRKIPIPIPISIPIKLKIQIKQKPIENKYTLTNKHIICGFKYLIVCLDSPPDDDLSPNGFVNLTHKQLQQFFSDETPNLDSNKDHPFLNQIVKDLKLWHPAVSRVEIDCQNLSNGIDLNQFPNELPQIQSTLKSLPTFADWSPQQFQAFTQCQQIALDIKVYFQLTQRVSKVSDLHINFHYVHELLDAHINQLNQTEPYFFDEFTVKSQQLPFAKDHSDNLSECYVYPQMYLISLYTVSKSKIIQSDDD